MRADRATVSLTLNKISSQNKNIKASFATIIQGESSIVLDMNVESLSANCTPDTAPKYPVFAAQDQVFRNHQCMALVVERILKTKGKETT